MDIWESIQPIWKVFAVGLALGAGLPAIFAIGIHFGASHRSEDGEVVGASPVGRVIAAVCIGIVCLAIAFGIAVLVDADTVLPAVGL